MTARRALGSLAIMLLLALPLHADGKGELQKYFSDTATKVKATDEPSEKRAILEGSFLTMATALDIVHESASLSREDRVGIERFRATLQEKRDELAGANGYVRVPDEQLNTFSEYVVQDMEQAEVITISLVTLVLIILLIVLLV